VTVGSIPGSRVDPDALAAYRGGILPTYVCETYGHEARGAHLVDVAGRERVDFTLGFGSVILGHADPRIDQAVARAVAGGVSPTLFSKLQAILCQELVTIAGGRAEQCILLRTGSDATSAAVRLARAFTGRAHVIRCGYNGWHDWSAPRHSGIPPEVRQLTRVVPLNDTVALTSAADELGSGQLAAIVLAPFETEEPSQTFLAELQRIVRTRRAIFILDEIRTGFRLALRGAQEYFGIPADVVVYSKALANGYCISAVLGPADVMACLSEVSLSSLYFRSVDGMAAALATIEILREGETLNMVWERGKQFLDGLDDVCRETGIAAEPIGLAPMPHHRFLHSNPDVRAKAEVAFAASAWNHGCLFHPSHHWFICGATREQDVETAILAARAGYESAQAVLDRDVRS